jgi:hypothetical protein
MPFSAFVLPLALRENDGSCGAFHMFVPPNWLEGAKV